MPRSGADPWAWHGHPLATAVVVIGAIIWLAIVHRWTGRPEHRGTGPTRRQYWLFGFAMAALLVTVQWPVADLAAHWSLIALVTQRLLLTLVAAPLLLAATPSSVLERLTRPAPVDAVLAFVTRPAAAIVTFTVIAVGTLLPGAVAAQASSAAARGGFDAVLLVGGLVLWAPVLRNLPGASRPGPVGMAAYLIAQSLVPTFLALVFVFAHHPLYAVYAHANGAIGLSPLADQQIAGIVGKVGTLPVLWTVAWWELSRARRLQEAGDDPDPLLWLDVQRRLQRAERLERQQNRRHRPRIRVSLRPQLVTQFPTVEPPDPSTGTDCEHGSDVDRGSDTDPPDPR